MDTMKYSRLTEVMEWADRRDDLKRTLATLAEKGEITIVIDGANVSREIVDATDEAGARVIAAFKDYLESIVASLEDSMRETGVEMDEG